METEIVKAIMEQVEKLNELFRQAVSNKIEVKIREVDVTALGDCVSHINLDVQCYKLLA